MSRFRYESRWLRIAGLALLTGVTTALVIPFLVPVDRYRLLLPLTGAEKGGAIVDFRHVEPAPEPIPARG